MKITLALLAVCGFASAAGATIVAESYGAAPRPGSVFGVPTKPAPFNPNLFTDTFSTPGAEGTLITFNPAVNVRQVGSGWATWSGGYTGNVFYPSGATSLTVDFTVPGGPNWIIAAQLYAEPNPFGVFDISAAAGDWGGATSPTITQAVDGNGGASGWGFYSPDSFIRSITITSDVDFAIGDLATTLFIPAPGPVAIIAFAAIRRRRPGRA